MLLAYLQSVARLQPNLNKTFTATGFLWCIRRLQVDCKGCRSAPQNMDARTIMYYA